MSVRTDSRHLALVATVLAFAPAFGATAQPRDTRPSAQAAATTYTVASIEPRVPPAAGQPCVVELLHNRAWPQADVYMVVDPTIVYMPPQACPPPWSKIILKLDVQSSRRTVLDSIGMDLARVRLFRSGAPHYDGDSSWHVERDLTDYSALFRAPHTGRIWSGQNPEAADYGWDHLQTVYHASAQLFFYPATAATPAPRVPDAVIAVNQNTPVNLPHNIVRAYVDVENGFLAPNPLWFTCWSDDTTVPLSDFLAPGTEPKDAIHPPAQGCGGGSFSEVRVRVDGTLAGIAPAFPLVIADLNWTYFRNSADQPIPTLEMLNSKPYRVDLSPFAAILSAAGPHSVTAVGREPGEGEGYAGGSTLLLYLDRNRPLVTGAVTLNTLATENGAATDTNTLAQSGDTIRGDIRTRQHRDFVIRGFVNTSGGRVDSSVHQTSDFSNVQAFHLEGPQQLPVCEGAVPKLYVQDVRLDSSTVQTSRRSRGAQLISRDQLSTRYPLQLTYHVASSVEVCDGVAVDFHRTNITVLQSRVVDGDHYKSDFGRFTSHAGARFYSTRKGGDEQTDPRWESYTTRNYTDNFGSCYHAELSSLNGAIIDRSLGGTCPDGKNHVRWFAHPDGSPDALGWWH
jgi:hypothetical protein